MKLTSEAVRVGMTGKAPKRYVWRVEKCVPLTAVKAALPWFAGALASGVVLLAFMGWVVR